MALAVKSLFEAASSYWYEHGRVCLGNVLRSEIVLPAGRRSVRRT